MTYDDDLFVFVVGWVVYIVGWGLSGLYCTVGCTRELSDHQGREDAPLQSPIHCPPSQIASPCIFIPSTFSEVSNPFSPTNIVGSHKNKSCEYYKTKSDAQHLCYSIH